MLKVNQNIADRWCGSPCSLNGKPAVVAGRLRQYGLVAPLDYKTSAVEYSWQAIDRIMNRDRAFKS